MKLVSKKGIAVSLNDEAGKSLTFEQFKSHFGKFLDDDELKNAYQETGGKLPTKTKKESSK